jgi:hypothetical protein
VLQEGGGVQIQRLTTALSQPVTQHLLRVEEQRVFDASGFRIEIWGTSLNLANIKDNWYRPTQGVYVFSKITNTTRHVGDEIDVAWTHAHVCGWQVISSGGLWASVCRGVYWLILRRTWAPTLIKIGVMPSSR